jgi:ribosomal protein S18 acetylase RimI-like enzyme
MQIRQAQPSDHLALRTIQESALAEYSPELLDTAVHGALGLLVADDGGPVGYALFLESGDVAVLLELAVDPPRQGEGIGSALLETACSHLEDTGHRAVRLTARASDDHVLRFYDRHGFDREEELPGYFESGDAVLLTREL